MKFAWKDHTDQDLIKLAYDYGLQENVTVMRGILCNRRTLEKVLFEYESKKFDETLYNS